MAKFLKPTKDKSILTLIFIIFSILFFIFLFLGSGLVNPKLLYLFLPTILLLDFLPSYSGELSGMPTTVSLIIFLIITLIYLYLLSCLLILIYKKVKQN
ncbi:hypothetical protein KAS41_03840 [Candidatus Parcubacteria bacterium]|nr:hypothetical protein [Candidatus Parcubacteria bacterium]